MQQLAALTLLTWKAAFRFRLFVVVLLLLLGSVIVLPLLLARPDQTAEEFTQVQITYTLGVITVLLGLSTLWLACGTLAREIEDCQIQIVVSKPVARWKIWLGKWLGILSLDAVLLALAGGCVYGQMLWQAGKLAPAQQAALRSQILVARGSVRPANRLPRIEAIADELLAARLATNRISAVDLPRARKDIVEQVRADFQIVPGEALRTWQIDLGFARNFLRNEPLYLRIKFNAADKPPSGTFDGLWLVGVPNTARVWRSETMSLAPDTAHEFPIPPNLWDTNGVLTVSFVNPNPMTLVFDVNDGIEVLYRESGFGLNFARGLGIIFCWMALMAALGLAASSFLSFPVAAFLSLGVLVLTMSTGTLATVTTEGTLFGYDAAKGGYRATPLDWVAVPLFRGLLATINLARDFSPIDNLSTGRSITWGTLGLAFAQIVLLLGGGLGLFGIAMLERRELASVQSSS